MLDDHIKPLGIPAWQGTMIGHIDRQFTVPIGVMADIGMPVGLTFAGRAYDDSALLRLASAYEATGSKRLIPPRTPPLNAH